MATVVNVSFLVYSFFDFPARHETCGNHATYKSTAPVSVRPLSYNRTSFLPHATQKEPVPPITELRASILANHKSGLSAFAASRARYLMRSIVTAFLVLENRNSCHKYALNNRSRAMTHAPSPYCLYEVPNPDWVQCLILQPLQGSFRLGCGVQN